MDGFTFNSWRGPKGNAAAPALPLARDGARPPPQRRRNAPRSAPLS